MNGIVLNEDEKPKTVLCPIGNSRVERFKVTDVFKRESIKNTEILTKNGKRIVLPNDSFVAISIPNRSYSTTYIAPDNHYLYLMHKRGYGYRIGTTKNARNRINGEHADKMWLIGSYDNITEALYNENLISSKYGIPTMTFVDHSAKNKRSVTARLTKPWIDKLFRELDTKTSAENFSSCTGFVLDTPHIVPQNFGERVSIYIDYYYAKANDKNRKVNPSHLISIETSDEISANIIEEFVDINKTKSKKDGYRFRKMSSDAFLIESLGLRLNSVLNGSLVSRVGIISSEFTSNRNSLKPFMSRAGNVLKGFLVPVLVENHIELEEVVSVERLNRKINSHLISAENQIMVCVNDIFVFSGGVNCHSQSS